MTTTRRESFVDMFDRLMPQRAPRILLAQCEICGDELRRPDRATCSSYCATRRIVRMHSAWTPAQVRKHIAREDKERYRPRVV
jgi:hypothetical protein